MIANPWLRSIAFAAAIATGACRAETRDLHGCADDAATSTRTSDRPPSAVRMPPDGGGVDIMTGTTLLVQKVPMQAGAHVMAWRRSISGAYPSQPAGIAPGEAPGPSYPAGTVYLARAENEGIYVTEWDLAANAIRRRLELVGAEEQGSMRLWRMGDTLHVLLWAYNGLASYSRLTSDLHWVATNVLGTVSTHGPAAIAADANLTVVVFDGEERGTEPPGPDPPSGLIAASFDGLGRPIAKRILQRESYLAWDLYDNAAVLGGKAFILLRTRINDVLELVVLGRHLDVERTIALQTPLDRAGMPVPSRGITLFAWHDHLFVRSPDAPRMIELAPAGNELRRLPACEGPVGPTIVRPGEDPDFWLQGEHVTLRDPDWIEWMAAGASIGSVPEPCPGEPEPRVNLSGVPLDYSVGKPD